MSNYDEARRLLNDGYTNDNDVMRANGLASLALVDELRAAREPAVEGVFILQKYNPLTDTEGGIVDVYRDRTEAYTERDERNDTAFASGEPVRYVIKEKEVK